MQFAVLTNPAGFDRQTVGRLASDLHAEVYSLQTQPSRLILHGSFTVEQLRPYIPPETTVETADGPGNPKLPFRPPTY